MSRIRLMIFSACAVTPHFVLAVTIPTVPVGNPANAADLSTGNLYGDVGYEYRIGTTEVTNAQYAEFLNAKAASDPTALYNAEMDSDARGGITRSGASGSFTYTAKTDMGNKPVNFVSWYDAIRFANWLHNGQGTGDTETGAYTLLGGTPTPLNALSISRNSGATWFMTSEDEWYKAAYHKNDGVTGNYWQYPTASDTPTGAEAPPGGTNSANFNLAVGTVTDVGAYLGSPSPYLTFDQGGNLWEWNEAIVRDLYRGLRGGSLYRGYSDPLNSSSRLFDWAQNEYFNVGFRVAAIASVPEPSSIALAAVALVGFGALCRRKHDLSSRGRVSDY